MAKTLLLGEKDEATYLASVAEFLCADVPPSWREFVIAHREEGFSAAYTAFMLRKTMALLEEKLDQWLTART